MSRVKVKKIKISIGEQDEGVTEMFNQMIGTGSVNLHIAWPRYQRIKSLCELIGKVFEQLSNSSAVPKHARSELITWLANIRTQISHVFRADLSSFSWNLSLVDDDTHKQFGQIYDEMKKSELIRTFILMCDRCYPYRKNFEDMKNMNHKFITTMAGVEWKPFQFTTLNYKSIFLEATHDTIELYMIALHKAFTFGLVIYNEIQSPDIDIDTFVNIILKSIKHLQKIPELSRCKEAFAKLRESVGMLKENFNTYYRDFVNTKDSSIIMQHFVLDVGKNSSAGAKVAGQFRVIINYYRKMTNGKVTDPRLSSLLERANKTFSETTAGATNLGVNIEETPDSDDVSWGDDAIDATAMTAEQLEKALQ